jgi:hypothetical protein
MSHLNFKNMKQKNLFSGLSLILYPAVIIFLITIALSGCKKDDIRQTTDTPQYTITQTISDEAQKNTMAFDALGFMTGCLGAQTFLPPGKVADYSGFQYLRDNDATNLGHNTSFVTIIAENILNVLNSVQIQLFVDAAKDQTAMINDFAYKRYPLCKAFRRLIENDIPVGASGLNEDSVKAYTARLYKIDGRISLNRARLFGQIINSLTNDQKAKLDGLKAKNGIGNWDSQLTNPVDNLHLDQDVSVVVMTYASEIYAWYAGSVDADVYFCPERQGTYFGSFYLKDWPAMGNPDYTINEQLTASAGADFYKILDTDQYNLLSNVVSLQKSFLTSIVTIRGQVSYELRKLMNGGMADSTLILSLSEDYGSFDGEISYLYAKYFSEVYQSMTSDQKSRLSGLSGDLGYVAPAGAFLYSQPVAMPDIENTDFMFK